MTLNQLTALHYFKDKEGISAEGWLALPEKVLQFGTGVLLRGLPDYFIDKANKQQLFNGRIVVVKSTDRGGTDVFNKQDGLYTHVEKGREAGAEICRTTLNTSISRVLLATTQWDCVLECAANPALQVIVSNTTEVGISLLPSDAQEKGVPVSFPGKLLSFLWKRYQVFAGSAESGMVIIPTELITENGQKLKEMVTTLAKLKGADKAFMHWLDTANDFCNSLVDRIVPGKPAAVELEALNQALGYQDELLIVSECYRLWAIETNSTRTKHILSFSEADPGVILAPSIQQYRELKLRLLNGTHSFSCGLALLCGFTTVKEAMADTVFSAYVVELMQEEIIPLLIGEEISSSMATGFALAVAERFRNPHIGHLWKNITLQYTAKMLMRNMPLVERHMKQYGQIPQRMALGFAGYFWYMRTTFRENDPIDLNGYPVFMQAVNAYLVAITLEDPIQVVQSVIHQHIS